MATTNLKVLQVPAGSQRKTANKIAQALANTGSVNVIHVKPRPSHGPKKRVAKQVKK